LELAIVFHPRSGRRPRRTLVEALRERLGAAGHSLRLLATAGDATDAPRILHLLRKRPVECLVVVGGDGTVREAAEALCALAPQRRPAIAVVPAGTANNAARAVDTGLPRARTALPEHLVGTLARGHRVAVDLGRCNGRVFLGSVGFGMDADILAWRNTHQHRVPGCVGGYPLYLASCAANAARPHGGTLRLEWSDGQTTKRMMTTAVNALVTNTAIHAGEFRFVSGDRHGDGVLDVLWNPNMGDYLGRYARAWPRHLAHERGRPCRDDPGVVAAQSLSLGWESPLAWQLDGEEMPGEREFSICVQPGALDWMVCPTRA
jgi:diacylglycerol kinase (ATP)